MKKFLYKNKMPLLLMMLLSLIVLILAIFNSRYEYESYIRMIKVCEPSIMDVIVGSVNKCNLFIIFSIDRKSVV